jgi:hypothetical protein
MRLAVKPLDGLPAAVYRNILFVIAGEQAADV